MCPDLLLHPPTADSRSTHGKAARVSVVWSIPSPGKTAKPVPPGSPSPRAGRLSSAVPCLPPREFCSLLPPAPLSSPASNPGTCPCRREPSTDTVDPVHLLALGGVSWAGPVGRIPCSLVIPALKIWGTSRTVTSAKTSNDHWCTQKCKSVC